MPEPVDVGEQHRFLRVGPQRSTEIEHQAFAVRGGNLDAAAADLVGAAMYPDPHAQCTPPSGWRTGRRWVESRMVAPAQQLGCDGKDVASCRDV